MREKDCDRRLSSNAEDGKHDEDRGDDSEEDDEEEREEDDVVGVIVTCGTGNGGESLGSAGAEAAATSASEVG